MTRLPGAATPAPRRILIVEDDADTAVTYRILLERHGHEISIATAAASALAILRHADIDVVLCDLGLPGEMSALELMSAMQHDPDLGHIPAIAVTGYGQAEDREQTAAAGFAAHLIKPVEFSVLRDTLKWVASTRRPPERAAVRPTSTDAGRGASSSASGQEQGFVPGPHKKYSQPG